ncbi:MAG: hypothetical protein U9O66_04100 [Patescibacteria group bacterium]|nr:hypothetical protein [Patescibacteria group bacterium]
MNFYRTEKFKKKYKKLPKRIREATKKQLIFLSSNSRHPSLNIKKMNNSRDIWERRITESYRFTFQIKQNLCILRNIGSHNILKKP